MKVINGKKGKLYYSISAIISVKVVISVANSKKKKKIILFNSRYLLYLYQRYFILHLLKSITIVVILYLYKRRKKKNRKSKNLYHDKLTSLYKNFTTVVTIKNQYQSESV